MACGGAWSLRSPWNAGGRRALVLESGSRATLLANFAATRNHFDGRVAPVPVGENVSAVLFAASRGSRIGCCGCWPCSTGAPKSSMPGSIRWAPSLRGQRHRGTQAGCAVIAVLATRPAMRASRCHPAFAIVNRAAAPLTSPARVRRPVTALWPSSATSALAWRESPDR